MADKTWAELTAEGINTVAREASANGYEVDITPLILGAIKVAGELSSVKLKILLAQSAAQLEIHNEQEDNPHRTDDDFIDKVLEELQ